MTLIGRKPTAATLQAIHDILNQTPQHLTQLGQQLTTTQLITPLAPKSWSPTDNDSMSTPLAPKSWSATEVITHLAACADIWGATIQAMLAPKPTSTPLQLPHQHPRDYQNKPPYKPRTYQQTLVHFQSQRTALLVTITSITAADWHASATIKNRRHTVYSQLRRLAIHEESHFEQLHNLLQQRID